MILGIDIETYSAVDLQRSTVYRYSEDPSFQILLFGYAIDDEPVTVLDLTQEKIPDHVLRLLTDPEVTKCAYNANFERVCLSRHLKLKGFLPPEQWKCTMVQALSCGLPRSLADVGTVLGLAEDKAKLKEGSELIRYFCKPCKPTKANGGRTRNLPEHAPDKWARFVAYNVRDVEVERTVRKIVESNPMRDEEWEAYWLDQRINDRGVLCDRTFVQRAIQIAKEHTDELTDRAVAITGLSNINSVQQLKGWLGVEGSLNKKTVSAMRESGNLGVREDELLAIRQELGKTSITKYEAMERGMCYDNRVRGLFQFYGANRTGRWAGRQVQVQNLPQNKIPDLDIARSIVFDKDKDGLQVLYGNVTDILSQLIRTAFIADYGRCFAVADFSAIEARVIAWLSDERWRLGVFKDGKDIYCASASKMFGVPVEKHGINGHLRQKGKIAELALGYGGSIGALKNMGALDMGLHEEELPPLVDAWRKANLHIVQFWWDVDTMVRDAITNRGVIKTMFIAGGAGVIAAKCSNKLLKIRLPSGRCICYWKPEIIPNKFGGDSITYGGLDAGKWGRVETYGPKLVENIVQATARDCLRDAMLRVARTCPDIVMHVHDEMIVETSTDHAEEVLSYMEAMMAEPLPWAPGLLLRGDGYLTSYYRKD